MTDRSPHELPAGRGLRLPRFARAALAAIALAMGLAPAHADAAGPPAGSAAPSGADVPSAAGIDAILGRLSNGDEFLPPDEAFQLGVFADGPDRVRVQWAIHDGYYLYKSRIKVATSDPGAQLGQPVLPKGQTKTDEYFGTQEVYHQDVAAVVPVARAAGATIELPLDVTYQGCADAGLCYPPITKHVKVRLPPGGGSATLAATAGGPPAGTGTAAPPGGGSAALAGAAGGSPAGSGTAVSAGFVSEQDGLAAFLREGNLAAVLATFFVIGLGLSLTPCVLPMVPILSGILVGQGGRVTPARGFSLAFAYVQGMALTYAAAGAVFVLAFGQTPQAFFQKPWIIALFAALFVALALAMFGAYTLQLPSVLQTRLTRLSNRQKSGTYAGCFIMGALSALVVTACVAPAVIGALSVISQTREVARGASALYVTGLGMGAPLLVVGASAGSLLPRVGPWMDTIKSLFGVLFLGVAIYFLQRLLPGPVAMLLWSALAVISGYWVFSLKRRDGGAAPAPVRASGLLALVYGVLLLVGAASGGGDPLQPLGALRAARVGPGAAESSAPTFAPVESVADLEARVAAASAAGRPVMLDFYADWCVSCKEMEKYTFPDPAVRTALRDAVLLRADVTENDARDQALLRHFGIFGPPTIAFYDSSGRELRNFRVVGYMKAPEFAALVRKALGAEPST